MKPRNFAGRKFRRRARAYRRLFEGGVLIAQSREAFVLHGKVPRAALTVIPPTDIRIRIGAKARKEIAA